MRLLVKILAASWISLIASSTSVVAIDGVLTRQIKGRFEDVFVDLRNAIIDQGLVSDTVLNVSSMLIRTGEDVGSTKSVYLQGQTIGFCSARLSRAAMEVDPQSLAFCPYSVFIYEAAATPETITIGYRELTGGATPASKESLDAINKLLQSIITDAGSN